MKCSRCKKDIEDVRVNIKLSISVYRKSESDVWEIIPNSNISPMEQLCSNCFDEFSEIIGNAMNV